MCFFALYLLAAKITSVYAENDTFLALPEYSADAVVLMDANTGLVLYEDEARTEMYPASITKIMTALIVLEQTTDLEERIEFSDESVWGIPRNSSHIYMDVGETLSIREALYALMLESANEVSVELATHIAGSEDEFADLMNRRAVSLGAFDTYFVNASGLPARGHVTTAYDMALIMREAIRNPIFVEIISSRRFDIPPTERQSETRHLLNTNRQIHPGVHYNEAVIGGKTGWTTAAGNTLVSYAAKDERHLIVTVLKGDGAAAFTDTTALLDYGFALPLETVTIFDASTYTASVPVIQEVNGSDTEIGRVLLAPEKDLQYELPLDWSPSWLRYELSVPETLAPPVAAGEAVGRVTVYVQDIRVDEIVLTAQEDVLAYSPVVQDMADEGEAADVGVSLAEEAAIAPYERFAFFSGRLAFLNNEYVLTLIVPLALSGLALVFSGLAAVTRNRRRLRKLLKARKARFERYPHYRYK
ncbi:MAG: D-alanyl-D-alanine carboxypeptidase [Defluviitaleaceae bacterium]|nr:D-alanyl-D-alanine carboxypeptidase [Defluviitaleaceae bacterium]